MEIDLAQTKAERDRIYRFRYQVYIKELGKNYLADKQSHVQVMLKDELDADAFHFYLNNRNKDVIGTMRIRFIDSEDVEFKHFRLHDQYEHCKLATVGRLMVARSNRAMMVGSQFTLKAFEFGLQNGIDFCFIEVEQRLSPLYERLGFKKISSTENSSGEMRIHFCLDLNDTKYLKTINSPFLRALCRLHKNTINQL